MYICPKCHKKHLVKSNEILTSFPPQYIWYCPDKDDCGYSFTGFGANLDWEVDDSIVPLKKENDEEVEKLKERCQDLEKEVESLKKEIYILKNPEIYEIKIPNVKNGSDNE